MFVKIDNGELGCDVKKSTIGTVEAAAAAAKRGSASMVLVLSSLESTAAQIFDESISIWASFKWLPNRELISSRMILPMPVASSD
jgi:hypothetical protein